MEQAQIENFLQCISKVVTLSYKTTNTFAHPKEKRPLFFISDPPHLIKTTRNCWSHSGYNGTRLMKVSVCVCNHCHCKAHIYLQQVNGKTIEWKHMKDLYDKLSSMTIQSSGLRWFQN